MHEIGFSPDRTAYKARSQPAFLFPRAELRFGRRASEGEDTLNFLKSGH